MPFPYDNLKNIQEHRNHIFTKQLMGKLDYFEILGLEGITNCIFFSVNMLINDETPSQQNKINALILIATMADVAACMTNKSWKWKDAVFCMEEHQEKRLQLGVKKNADYGSVIDGIAFCGIEGLQTRIFDKVARAISLISKGQNVGETNESLEDTFLDLGNYADYAIALLNGEWNTGEES